MLKQLVKATRSVRRFKQDPAPDLACLEELVALARLTPSASNLQPLRYFLVCGAEDRDKVFACVGWAGYLPEWDGPGPEERPTAYIIILSDPKISANPGIDVGLVTQTILLGAREKGFGGCALGSVQRERLQGELGLPSELKIALVIALGAPGEEVQLTEAEGGQIRYWRTEDDVHMVPKRPLDELIYGW